MFKLKKDQKLNFKGKEYSNEALLPDDFASQAANFAACVVEIKEVKEAAKPRAKKKAD